MIVGNGTSTNPQVPSQMNGGGTSNRPAAQAPETPDEINARLLREQWADWENRFRSYQQQAFATITDPEERARLDQEALENATGSVDTAFKRARSSIATLASRNPTKTDPQMQQARERQLSLAHRSARVNAHNQTQIALGDREMYRLTG